MVSRKSKKGKKQKQKKKSHGTTKASQCPPPSPPLGNLFLSIQSPEGLKPENMKILYALLVHWSMNGPTSWSYCESQSASACPHLELGTNSGVKFNFKDVRDLSDTLFRELDERFRVFFSALHGVSADGSHGEGTQSADIWDIVDQLLLILRCCLLVLAFIALDQSLLMEKCQVLRSILGRLISIGLGFGDGKSSIIFRKMVSREQTCVAGDCATSVTEEFVTSIRLWEASDPCYSFLRSLLEVFADELLVHKSLRDYFMLIDSASSKSEMLFACHFEDGNIGSVLEVIGVHFILSISDEQAFENFLNRLFWCHGEDFRIPELSVSAALSLLLNPIILCAPEMFQAYLAVLVSEAIGIHISSEKMGPDLSLLNCYLTAFERSVILYMRHISHVLSLPISGNCSVRPYLLGCNQPTFESFLQPATRDKLFHLIAKSHDSWNAYLSSMSFQKNSDLVAASIMYVKDSLCVLDEYFKDEMLSILTCIILESSSDDNNDTFLFPQRETSSQDIYLLASIIKLMSSSMFQAMWHMKHFGFLGSRKPLENITSCKEYVALMNIVGRFEQLSTDLPFQKFLREPMPSSMSRHKGSKWMFFHFSGLLPLCYASGLDFLVKDCLLTLMVLLNLLITEVGDLSAIWALFGSRSNNFSWRTSGEVEKALLVQKSSQKVLSKILKIQEMYLRTHSHGCPSKTKEDNRGGSSHHEPLENNTDSDTTVNSREETCNGEVFLKCLLGENSKRSSDIDDLSDFIECKRGKDYSDWLRDRQKFRLWKYKRMTTLKKKKKMIWLKGR